MNIIIIRAFFYECEKECEKPFDGPLCLAMCAEIPFTQPQHVKQIIF
jgi:hypothetical protein